MWLFVQQLAQANIRENVNGVHCEFNPRGGHRWIPS